MIDALTVLLCGALVWSLLMLGVQGGQALSEAVEPATPLRRTKAPRPTRR